MHRIKAGEMILRLWIRKMVYILKKEDRRLQALHRALLGSEHERLLRDEGKQSGREENSHDKEVVLWQCCWLAWYADTYHELRHLVFDLICSNPATIPDPELALALQAVARSRQRSSILVGTCLCKKWT